MREKELFHDHLESIYQRFGRDIETISLNEAASYIGCDRRTLLADRTFPVRKQGRLYKVSKINLARWLA